jgi:hypothetical protein
MLNENQLRPQNNLTGRPSEMTYHWDTMNLENEFVYQGYNML